MIVALFMLTSTTYLTHPARVENNWADTGRRFPSMEACMTAGRLSSGGDVPSYRCEWSRNRL